MIGPNRFYVKGAYQCYLYFQPAGQVWVWNSDFRHASPFESEADARLAIEDCRPEIRADILEIQEWTDQWGDLVSRCPVLVVETP